MIARLYNYHDFEQHVRARPAMFVGNNIVIGLMRGLIVDCIKLCNTDDIQFHLTLLGANQFSVKIASPANLAPFISSLAKEGFAVDHYCTKVLLAISRQLDVEEHHDGSLALTFMLDEQVVTYTNIDYLELNDTLQDLAMLYRSLVVVSEDARGAFVSCVRFHFPEGIIYAFERAIKSMLGKPKLKLVFDARVNDRSYQLCLAYRTDWYPEAQVVCYANTQALSSGGILLEGIKGGLVATCRKYAGTTQVSNLRITRKKLVNGLIVYCAVKDDELNDSSSYEQMAELGIRREVKKITERMVYDFLIHNTAYADEFLSRFDTTDLMSKMY